MSKSDKNSHYVNNAKLFEEIRAYHKQIKSITDEDQDIPPIPEYIGEAIYLIASNLTNKPNFINYPFKDEMIGEGVIDCIKAVRNFDPEKSNNPFAYFTSICWYAFIRVLKKEKKQGMVKYALVEKANGMGDYTKWLQDNERLDPHAGVDDIQRYHSLTDDDVKELNKASSPDKKKKKRKKKETKKKRNLFDED